jgi:RNA polymerase sigma-70 factor (ECF subfamily)
MPPTAIRARPALRVVGAPAEERVDAWSDLADAQLVALVVGGDGQAFESLYRRHAGFAINLAIRIQGSGSDVEDVVHDAFMRALNRMHELRDADRFRSWLGSIVVRLVKTRLRRRRLVRALGLGVADPVELDSLASSDASPEQRAQIAQIYALLRTLPTTDHIAWTLRHIERHPLEEVANLTGCSLATAKRRIQRVQRYLSEHFVSPSPESVPE